MNNAVAGKNRILYLDGLRGLAILAVLGWHYLGPTYAAKLPYQNKLSWIPLFNHGWVGVYLFFLISGYVIFMTIETCSNFVEFLKRRWLRLFPAMLFASVVILAVTQFLGAFVPRGKARLTDIIPGLTFISDSFWHAILHNDMHGLDGDFWTLYVEFSFYIIFGISYFILGWQRALACLVTLWLTVFTYSELVPYLPKSQLVRLGEPLEWLGMGHYGWFAAGAIFYKARELDSNRLFLSACALAGLAILTFRSGVELQAIDYLYLTGCLMLFAAAQRLQFLQRFLEYKLLLFIGAVSYPLYLLHNELGIGLIGALAPHLATAATPLLPAVVAALMVAFAWLVATFVEPTIRSPLKQLLRLERRRAIGASI